jgi:Phosphotransferase enzyme family
MSRSTWPDAPLLSPDTVGDHLAARGLVEAGRLVSATELGGGVSNVVLSVDAPGLRAIVKQSLPRLRVQEEWLAKRERVLTEAEALRLAGRITPGAAPSVLDVHEESYTIVIDRAPDGWRTWKDDLLAGSADPAVAARLGELLAAWHRETESDGDVARRFSDLEAFEQLRIDPYHRAVVRRWPHLGRAIAGHIDALLRTRSCLVHGDFSPKNVLVGEKRVEASGFDDPSRPGRLSASPPCVWIVDFEVAHVGEPVFDVAFMLNHLMLKALHRPADADAYRACAAVFWSTYQEASGPIMPFDRAHLVGHIGCLMLARVDGKSPAEYLTEAEQLAARALGSQMLLHPDESFDHAWAKLEAALDS